MMSLSGVMEQFYHLPSVTGTAKKKKQRNKSEDKNQTCVKSTILLYVVFKDMVCSWLATNIHVNS